MQNVVFSITKGLNGESHSSFKPHSPIIIKKISPANTFRVPPCVGILLLVKAIVKILVGSSKLFSVCDFCLSKTINVSSVSSSTSVSASNIC